MQAVRRKIEGDEEAAGRAAWVEHAAARMMAEGLDDALPASAPGGDGQDAGGGLEDREMGVSGSLPPDSSQEEDGRRKAGPEDVFAASLAGGGRKERVPRPGSYQRAAR